MRIAMLIPDNRDEFRRYEDPEPYFGPAPTALLDGLARFSNCEIHVVSCVQRQMRSPQKLAGNIYYHSLLVPKWGWLRGGYAGCVQSIRSALRRIKPDLVHGQGTERYCGLGAAWSGHRNILTIHGNQRALAKVNGAKPFSFLWMAARLERFTLPRVGGVICITHFTERQVEGLAHKTWVVPNAVDAQFFEVERIHSNERLVLCVGEIAFHKNQNPLIRALDPLAKQHAFSLVFLGQANRERPYVREFFSLLETRPWCRYEGFADRSGVRSWLQRTTLLVLPSLADNCPMVVIEAAAAGVPVAAANVGGVPDLIKPGSTGLLLEPTDPIGIRQAVERLLVDPVFADSLALTAKQQARERFHPSTIATRHLEIYSEMTQPGRASSE